VTSSQPVVTPNALNFTPDNKHAYAYSGTYQIDTTAFLMLEFQTNSEILVGQFVGFGPVKFDGDLNTGAFGGFQYSFNDNVVAITKTDTSQHDMGQYQEFKCIIPPFTNVKVKGLSYTTTSGMLMEVVFTGKAFGMTDTGFQ